jgi:hypothetical protein
MQEGCACHPCQVAEEGSTAFGEEPRSQVIMAFLGVGLHQPPSSALAVSALADARRMVGALLSRGGSGAHWLAEEPRLHGIRENAATLAVMEVQDYRHGVAHAYGQKYPDRLDVLGDLLAVLT